MFLFLLYFLLYTAWLQSWLLKKRIILVLNSSKYRFPCIKAKVRIRCWSNWFLCLQLLLTQGDILWNLERRNLNVKSNWSYWDYPHPFCNHHNQIERLDHYARRQKQPLINFLVRKESLLIIVMKLNVLNQYCAEKVAQTFYNGRVWINSDLKH